MKRSLVDRISDYVLGDLPADEMRQMAQVLAESPARAHEAALVLEALALYAETLPPIAPSAAGRERLLATLGGVDRFRPFLGPLCQLVDLSEDAVRRLLARIDDAQAWELGPVPGLYLAHFDPGPRLRGVDAGFVRITAGQAVPRHRHFGPEVSLVLEGMLWEGGVGYFPGQLVERGAGSVHGFCAGNERDLVFAVTHSGVEIV